MERTNSIDFWRVVFTYMIAIMHFTGPSLSGWCIGVEFFFIVAGFLLCANQDINGTQNKKTALLHAWERIKKIFPHFLWAFLAFFITNCYAYGYDIKQMFTLLFGLFYEFFMIRIWGFQGQFSNFVTWYIDVYIAMSYLIYWLLANRRKLYLEIIAPLAVLLLYANFSRQGKGINEITTIIPFIPVLMLRGFAGMSLGCLCYCASKKIKARNWNVRYRKFFCAFEFFSFLFVIWFSATNGNNTNDYTLLFLMAVAIIASFLNTTKNKLMHNKVVSYLSKISLSIYLNHLLISVLKITIFPEYPAGFFKILFMLVETTLYSMFTYWVCETLKKKISKAKQVVRE